MREAVKSRMHAVNEFRSFSYAIVGVVIAIEVLVVFLTDDGLGQRAHARRSACSAPSASAACTSRGSILIEARRRQRHRRRARLRRRHGVTYAVLPAVAESAAVGVDAVARRWPPSCWPCAIGALASLYPALRAGKMDPTEALRAL